MTGVEVLGWVAAVIGMVIALPQAFRLLRTRDPEGIAKIAWQLLLAMNLGWAFHGIRIMQPNMVAANVIGGASTVLVLALLAKDLRISFWRIALPSFTGAAVLIAADLIFGSGVFGTVALVPAIVSNIGQSVKLVRSPQVGGVSPFYLAGVFVNQAAWLAWGILVPELSTIIASTVTGLLGLFNLVWLGLRRAGVRAFFATEPELADVPGTRATNRTEG